MPRVQIKRGTRSQIDSAALSDSLNIGELYLITDENRIAVGTGINTYSAFALIDEVQGSTTSWEHYATNIVYTNEGEAITGGIVYTGTYAGNNIYRYISTALTSDGYPEEDSFYETFTGGELSDLLATRGITSGFGAALNSWEHFATNSFYTGVSTAVSSGGFVGIVYTGTYSSNPIYRYISTDLDSNGYPVQDSFYRSFSSGVLANLVATRGVTGVVFEGGDGGGVPLGGLAGQILAKLSDSDLDLEWIDYTDDDGGDAGFVASPISILPGSGLWVGTALTGSLSTANLGTNSQIIGPYSTGHDFTTAEMGISVSTIQTSEKIKIVIFGSDSNGRPTTALFESSEIDIIGSGTYNIPASFSFEKNKLYWVGVWLLGNVQLRAPQAYCHVPLTWSIASMPVRTHFLQRNLAFADPNSNWSYNKDTDHSITNTNAPFVLFKIA